ncbi:MAG TPA: hypothetical protein VIV58_26380, partial [Kofleriaceae bacterium]
MSFEGGTRDGQAHDRGHDGDHANAQVTPEAAPGVGTARLRMLMIGGLPSPEAVAKLVAEYPRERDSLVGVCMQTFGNSHVQHVIKASARQAPAKPVEPEKPAEAAAQVQPQAKCGPRRCRSESERVGRRPQRNDVRGV